MPGMHFIKLYHSVWELDLSPNAFRTYCALLRFSNTSTGYANVSMKKIAVAVGLSEKSAHRGVRELQENQLVRKTDRRWRGHKLANGYLVTRQYGRFTKVPLDVLAAPVSACGFMTYAYLLKCADAKMKAFPSLSGIASAIGITVKTVIEQIKRLVSLKLLRKKHYIRKDRRFGHNRYSITKRSCVRIRFPQNEKTRPNSVSPRVVTEVITRHTFNYKILQKSLFVKTLSRIFMKLSLIWYISPLQYCNSDPTSTRPTFTYKRKRKKKLYSEYRARLE